MLIATRELTFQTERGEEVSVPVSLFSPVRNDKDWGCPYSIEWPNGIEKETVYGVDSVQALILAIQRIGNSLYGSDYHKTGRLRWENPHDGYGFPVSSIIRDLLIGSDKANAG